jgi:MinD-like ATPase involved in chromosome partitioning or flagellar assembly
VTQVVTFYSYKGGVGRTMSLVNVAHVLAREGQRVLMVDFDLEAPGMTHFFGEQVRSRPPEVKYDALDLLLHARASYEEARAADRSTEFPESLAEYVIPIELPRKWRQKAPEGSPYLNGRLDLLPATLKPSSDSPEKGLSRDYLERLDALDLPGIFGAQGPGHFFGDHIRQYFVSTRFEAQGDILFTLRETVHAAYDIVLVDSRTGLNEISGLCIGPLCDALVVCCGLNRQNVEGTRYFAERAGLLDRKEGKPYLIVASPVPPWMSREVQGRIAAMKRDLRVKKIFEIPYNPVAAVEEIIFVVKEPQEAIAAAYEALAPAVGIIGQDEKSAIEELEAAIYQACEYKVKNYPSLVRSRAKRLGLVRLDSDAWSRRLPRALNLFPSAITLSTLPRFRQSQEKIEAMTLGAAVAAYRSQLETPFTRLLELVNVDEQLLFTLEFFRSRVLRKPPVVSREVQDLLARWSKKKVSILNFGEAQQSFVAHTAILSAQAVDSWLYPSLSRANSHRKLGQFLKDFGSWFIDSVELTNMSLALGGWEEWWKKNCPRIFLVLNKPVFEQVDANKILRLLNTAPLSLQEAFHQYGKVESLWVFPEHAEIDSFKYPRFRKRPHLLGLWPEPLMAAAVARAKGYEGMDEVLAWIALARMTYGYAWRVLVDWRHLESVKDHPRFQGFLREEDEMVEEIESAIDQGIYPL